MPEEIRRETTEVVNHGPTGSTTSDPVTGEVLPYTPAETTVVTSDSVASDSYQTATYTGDPYAARRMKTFKLTQAIYLLFAILEGLLAIRFVLRVLGANPAAGFAQLVYGITAPFMAPFVGLFGEPTFGASVFEWTALVAMIVYVLLAWVIVRLVWLAAGETRTAAVTRSTHVEDHIER